MPKPTVAREQPATTERSAPWPTTDRDASEAVSRNFFLHVYPVRTRQRTLRLSYSLGLGVISTVLFLLLTVTGVILMFYYVPSIEHAYASMKDLRYSVSFGRVMRNLHRWSAHGMVLVVFLHMCRVFYTGGYKHRRAFNWVIGVVLLLLTLFLSFTGYLLPWDQLAFWAITVGTTIASYAPVLGEKIRFVLLGGNEVGQSALLRFYVLHCVFLPLVTVVLVGVHLWRVRKDGGLSAPDEHERRGQASAGPPETIFAEQPTKTYGLMAVVRGTPPRPDLSPDDTVLSWPHLLYRLLLLSLVVINALVVLSFVLDAPLEEHANPAITPNPAKAPWYFLGLQELVAYSAFVGGVLVPTLLVVALALVPYIDRNPAGVGRWFAPERKVAILIFTLCMLANLVVMLIGTYCRGPGWDWYWPWEPWPLV